MAKRDKKSAKQRSNLTGATDESGEDFFVRPVEEAGGFRIYKPAQNPAPESVNADYSALGDAITDAIRDIVHREIRESVRAAARKAVREAFAEAGGIK